MPRRPGCILLTNDGELANRLTHPRYGVRELYRARVRRARPAPLRCAGCGRGCELDDGPQAPRGFVSSSRACSS